ncbi:MAG TPA: hypothetical protein VLX92_12725, partial [Kofleriaceae bacterium]|nr:hypothetical protein [Kofleriaceae bacterium]
MAGVGGARRQAGHRRGLARSHRRSDRGRSRADAAVAMSTARRYLVLLVIGACGSSTPHPRDRDDLVRHDVQSPFDRAFQRVDALLGRWRPAMCAELGRPVPVPEPEYRLVGSPESRLAECERGDPRACFWVGDGLEQGRNLADDGTTVRFPADPVRARELYRRSCEGGFEIACSVFDARMRGDGDHAARIALTERLCARGQTELCAGLWAGLDPTDRATLAHAHDAMQAALERDCAAGRASACSRRARLACDRDARCQAARPWLERSCAAGSADACGQAHPELDGSIGATDDIVAARCHGTACDRV